MKSLLAFIPALLVGSSIPIAEELVVPPRETKRLVFSAPSQTDGYWVLSFLARLEAPRRGGYTYVLRVKLNGTELHVGRLLNRLPYEERRDGVVKTTAIAGGKVFAVDYSDRFLSHDRHPRYSLKSNRNVFLFRFDVTDLLRQGENELVIENAIVPPLENRLILRNICLVPVRRLDRVRPAATEYQGEPPRWEVKPAATVPFDVKQPEPTVIEVRVADARYRVRSRFSTPDGSWNSGTNSYYGFDRQVRVEEGWIIVTDTFTNRTEGDVPIVQQHIAEVLEDRGLAERQWQRVWLAGLEPDSRTGTKTEPPNPTSFGITTTAGLGLLPLNDVFLVHTRNSGTPERLVLEDREFVLRAGATYRAEWAIVPVSRRGTVAPWNRTGGDTAYVWQRTNEPYFSFVNAVRRLRDVNFTLYGPFVFLRADPRYTGKWSDEEIVQFIRYKSAYYLCSSIDYPRYRGRYAHGTAFQLLDHSYRIQHLARLRRLVPDVKHLVYFHCFLDTRDEAAEEFAQDRLLLPNGRQGFYNHAYQRLFIPRPGGAFAEAVRKNVDIILDHIGADGVYWDEMEFSKYRYHHGEPWDGVSGDIDGRTFRLVRKKSSVELLSQPWRVKLAREILRRGPLVANSQPHTRTMMELKFPRFVETGSISNCARAQLFSPIALGDHLSERSEEDAYRVMRYALRYGCLYYWYNDLLVRPTHHHLTRYMFPLTPVELHEGVVLGRERIVTIRSGEYTWLDESAHEVHVFGADSRELDPQAARKYYSTYQKGGHTITRLELPEGFSAAIVRVAAASAP